jgi:Glycosyltransferase sugar-binding region containing DXD motif
MPTSDPLEESHRRRSNFVRGLVQRSIDSAVTFSELASKPPQKIVQFWDDLNRLPGDVGECIATWKKAEKQGFERLLFDKHQAGEFIHQRLGQRYKDAFNKCYHPAMQSDYFRLCYILVEGGCYIDADDVFNEAPIRYLCDDGRLKIQPLCYDLTTNMMVPPSLFARPGADASGWIFYFNMNPLIAGSRHPLIDRALAQATLTLEKDITSGLPEIQATAGPGNLTKSIFDAATEGEAVEQNILVLRDWEQIATSKWPLSYRNDARNWRLSNCRAYQETPVGNV